MTKRELAGSILGNISGDVPPVTFVGSVIYSLFAFLALVTMLRISMN